MRNKRHSRSRAYAAACLVAAAFLFVGGLAMQVRADDSRPVIRLSSANLPPVMTPAQDGYLDRILAELFDRVGHTVVMIDVPPRRGLIDAANGLHDGDAGRLNVITQTFPDLIAVTPPVLSVDMLGLYISDTVDIRSYEDFRKYSVGYLRGWRIAEAKFGDHPDAIAVSTPDVLMRMLTEGRIEVAFLTRAPARYIAETHGITDLKESAFYDRYPLHIHLNKRHADLLPDLSAALTDMKADGTIDAILSVEPAR